MTDFRGWLGFGLAVVLLGTGSLPAGASTYENIFGQDILLREIPFDGDPGPPIDGVPDLFPGAQAPGAELPLADLFEANLQGVNLDGADLGLAVLELATLVSASLVGASLFETEAFDTNMTLVNFSMGDLEGFIADTVIFTSADFTGADLTGAEFIESTLGLADFTGATLLDVDFFGSSITGAVFANANLQGAFLDFLDFTTVTLSGADLQGADLSNSFNLGLITADPTPSYGATTVFDGAVLLGEGSDPFDPVAAGWMLVPEPTAGWSGVAVLALLAQWRRREGAAQ